MLLDIFFLVETWHSLRNLVSGQWRFYHKNHPSVPSGIQRRNRCSVSVLFYSYNLKKKKKKKPSLGRGLYQTTMPLLLIAVKLLTSHSSRTLPPWSVCLSTSSQTFCLLTISYILPSIGPLSHLIYSCFFNFTEVSSLSIPPPSSLCCLSVLSSIHFFL